MLEVFNLTLNKVGLLLIYIGIGYLLRRTNKLPEKAGHVLSLLCTLVFTPAYNVINLSQNLRMEVLEEKLLIFGYGAIFSVVAVILGLIIAKPIGRTPVEKSSLTYAFTFPNSGYFGYPVIEGVFGGAMLADFMIFATPIGLLCNSYGYILFQKEKKFNFAKFFLTPLVASLLVGAVIGLTGLQLPNVVKDALSGAGSCMSPCSMLLAGFMLGKFPLKQLFSGIRPYYLTAIRMIGIPIVFAVILFLCGMRDMYLFLPLVFVCLPLGLNLVVYPESCGYEKDAGENAKLCFVSYVLALGILPCIFALLTKMCL